MAILGVCSGCMTVVTRMGRCGVADAWHVRLGSCFDPSRPMQVASFDADPQSFHRNTITQAHKYCNIVSHDGAQMCRLVNGVLFGSGRRY
jgi:hypothetical protein